MSLKNKFYSVLTVAIAVVAFSTFTLAQDSKATTPAPGKEKAERHSKGEGRESGRHEGRGEGFGYGGGMMRMMQELNLTEAQKTQIHAIMDANKPDKVTMEELETLTKAKHDGTITAAQQERLTVLKTQTQEKWQSIHQQIMPILTPEQKAQLEQKKQEMKQRMQERRQQKAPAATAEAPKEN